MNEISRPKMDIVIQIEHWLKLREVKSLSGHQAEGETLLAQAIAGIKDQPDSGPLLGPRIKTLRSQLNKISKMESLSWIPCLDGEVAIGHRPGAIQVEGIALQGGSHILTLITLKEGADTVLHLAGKAGLKSLHFPMDSAKPVDPSRMDELRTILSTCRALLCEGKRLYIHCSAGIHRTGYITWILLRFCGLNSEETAALLAMARAVTADQVGAARLAEADRLADALTWDTN